MLVDTEHLYYRATREILAEIGVALDEALYRQLFLLESRGAWHLASERGLSAAQVDALKVARDARYVALLGGGDLVFPDVMPLLRSLGARHRMAIVTSSHRAHFEALHHAPGRATGLPALFELVLTHEDYRATKPDPAPYLCAVDRLGVPPAECLVIEDSRRGLLAAHAAGLRCWVIPSPLTAASSFAEAERTFASRAELAEALLALAAGGPEGGMAG